MTIFAELTVLDGETALDEITGFGKFLETTVLGTFHCSANKGLSLSLTSSYICIYGLLYYPRSMLAVDRVLGYPSTSHKNTWADA